MRGTSMLARVSKASRFTLLVSKQSRFAFSVKEPSSIGSSSINAMRHARPPSLRYGAPSSCGQHSRTTWPRRRPCGVGLTTGKAGRFTYRLNTLQIIGMSLLSVVIMFLSFAAGLFAIREIKILAEGDVERYQVVRAISLITMTITPYFIPDPWNNVAVVAGLLGLVVSFFLKPKDYL